LYLEERALKRDMELVRKILLHAEKAESGSVDDGLDIEGYTEHQIAHHVYLMEQAGLVRAFDPRP
jgi:hypothetical protein